MGLWSLLWVSYYWNLRKAIVIVLCICLCHELAKNSCQPNGSHRCRPYNPLIHEILRSLCNWIWNAEKFHISNWIDLFSSNCILWNINHAINTHMYMYVNICGRSGSYQLFTYFEEHSTYPQRQCFRTNVEISFSSYQINQNSMIQIILMNAKWATQSNENAKCFVFFRNPVNYTQLVMYIATHVRVN